MSSPTRLRADPTGRHLVDGTAEPVFLNGDSAWSIVVSERAEGWATYFADRAARGFNAVIVNAIEALFTADPPRTVDGVEPFLEPGVLTRPNPAYWDRVDAMLDVAAGHGMYVLLAPLYLGYIDPHFPGFGFTRRDEGWHPAVRAAGEDGCRTYGAYLGARYRDRDNLVWVIGGDRNPGELLPHVRAFVAGIKEHDEGHLMTAHVHPDASPVEQYEGDAWLTLNQTYSYQIVHRKLIDDWRRSPARPFVLFESTYEGEHDATELQVRRQAWWALTCGATGQFLGNFHVWLMAPGWQASLDSAGARSMAVLGSFVREVPWWTTEPDLDHSLAVAGLGEENGLDRASALRARDGSLGIVYVPTPRILSVNLEAMTGWTTVVRWFDPVLGTWTSPVAVTRRGVVQLGVPFDHDAVVVLADPAAGAHGPWVTGGR
jgi:hypothetical protein